MTAVLSVVCAGLALVSTAAVLVRSRDVRLALRVLLELLLAAGLVRLAGDAPWRDVGVVAVLLVARLAVR